MLPCPLSNCTSVRRVIHLVLSCLPLLNMSPSRYEACSILQEHHINCAIWFEDAIAHYGVPTVLFDFYLLVPDIEKAAELLRQHGWHTAPRQDADIFHFLEGSPMLKLPLSYLRLIPPGWDEKVEDRTVLMPADTWNFTAYPPTQSLTIPGGFYPPLPALLDSLIDGWLDAPRGSNLQSHVSVQLAYVYGHVAQVKETSFVEQLRPEHRQFHLDYIEGRSIWTLPCCDHQREVRDGFLKG